MSVMVGGLSIVSREQEARNRRGSRSERRLCEERRQVSHSHKMLTEKYIPLKTIGDVLY